MDMPCRRTGVRVDHRRSLVALALCCYAGLASAGFAQLAPPSGWMAGTATAPSTFNASTAAANSATFGANTVRTTAALNVGGRAIEVPAAMRFAANASRFAAGQLFNPYAITAVALALAIPWAAQKAVEMCNEGGEQFWCKNNGSADGWEYSSSDTPGQWFPNPASAAKAAAAARSATDSSGRTVIAYTRYSMNGPGAAIWWANVTLNGQDLGERGPYGLTSRESQLSNGKKRLTQPEFESEMEPLPLPEKLPQLLPKGVPIQDPVINPNPELKPQPMFVPQGLPVPVPNTDPQQYRQPGIRVAPAPTPAEPWRVDVQPVDRIGTSPIGATDPVTEPAEGDPATKPSEKDSDLCVKNPEILACQKLKLGYLEPRQLEKKTVPLAINREEGFGPADAACPAARSFSVMGKTFEFQWTPMCDFAHGIRPLLIGFAYLSAVLAFMGLSRKDS